MNKKVIVDIQHDQTRIAILEENKLAEIYIEEDDTRGIAGNIYKGVVENVLPGMQAAFIDIGLERNAFLYIGDISTEESVFEFSNQSASSVNEARAKSIKDIIKTGQEIRVQVLKEPFGTKGARVTTQITLPGKYIVLMPTVNYVGVSRKIEDESERQRLKEIAESIKPEGMGVIIRTAAVGKKESDFTQDLEFLCRLWTKIQDKEWRGKIPRLLYEDEEITYRIIRDIYASDIEKIIINDETEYKKTLESTEVLFPKLKDRIEYFDDPVGIFQYYNIESKIEKAIQKKVWLKNGGYLIIDITEALTVIDVNTGKYVGTKNLEDTVLKTNLEAAEEIASQIRLRDIGGIIIIDFIDMEMAESKDKVLNLLIEATKKDRTKTSVLGFTGLGLVEMTRKKVRQRLASKLLKPCPYCHGTGRVYSENMIVAKIEKELEELVKDTQSWGAVIESHPDVARSFTEDLGRNMDILEETLNIKLYIKENPNLHVEDSLIHRFKEEKDAEKYFLEQGKD